MYLNNLKHGHNSITETLDGEQVMKRILLVVCSVFSLSAMSDEVALSSKLGQFTNDPIVDTSKLSPQFYNHYKTGLTKQLNIVNHTDIDINLSVMRPRHNGLSSGSFETVNNPIFQERNTIFNLSIRKSF